VIQNPWPGEAWAIVRSGQLPERLKNQRASLSTRPGETFELKSLRP
jgi:hypothetical protein